MFWAIKTHVENLRTLEINQFARMKIFAKTGLLCDKKLAQRRGGGGVGKGRGSRIDQRDKKREVIEERTIFFFSCLPCIPSFTALVSQDRLQVDDYISVLT